MFEFCKESYGCDEILIDFRIYIYSTSTSFKIEKIPYGRALECSHGVRMVPVPYKECVRLNYCRSKFIQAKEKYENRVSRNVHGYPASMVTRRNHIALWNLQESNASMPARSSQDQGPPCLPYEHCVAESFLLHEVHRFWDLVHVDVHAFSDPPPSFDVPHAGAHAFNDCPVVAMVVNPICFAFDVCFSQVRVVDCLCNVYSD